MSNVINIEQVVKGSPALVRQQLERFLSPVEIKPDPWMAKQILKSNQRLLLQREELLAEIEALRDRLRPERTLKGRLLKALRVLVGEE